VPSYDIGYGEVFEKTINAFESGKKIVIHRGGTGSGKTEDIMIFLIFVIALNEQNKIITVVSESRPHLDIGVIRIMKKHLMKAGIFSTSEFNETSARYHFKKTGTILEFFSADRIDKALGARRDWLFGNEINSLKQEEWDELARRSENVIADFNPTIQFWLEDWLANYDHTAVITSNHLDNPFLPETERQKIIKRAERDPNFYRVHILCEYGGMEGLIYPNWSYGEFDTSLPYGFGLDFGFHPDPDSMVKVAIDKGRKKIYLKECFYETNQLLTSLKQNVLRHCKPHELIVADSANPRMIAELKNEFNIVPVVKYAGSVVEGIRIIQDYDLVVDKESVNLIKELRNYIWSDKKAGIPVDEFNHLLDGARYYAMNQLTKKTYFNYDLQTSFT
jgi:phage terminase large subunit